ncbi:hypothetical protein ACEPAH_8493 [Sanghuangporus vaninii]
MCRYNSQIAIYKCGAVEHVERKDQDCERKDCISSKAHPWTCVPKPFAERLKEVFFYRRLRSPEHSPACRNNHDLTYSFTNNPTEQCCDNSCKLVQDQSDEGFKEAVEIFREDISARDREMERAEQDAASTVQLRDVPM